MISVIMPVFNASKHLDQAIRSVLLQTYDDWELILVDDGSTDDSLGICRRYGGADPRVRVMHQENSGVSSARNSALQVARGDMFCFVDSDDSLRPDALRTLLSALTRTSGDVVVGAHSSRTPSEDRAGEREGTPSGQAEPIVYSSAEAVIHLLYGRIASAPWGKLFKRQAVEGVRFDERLSYGEDWRFNLEVFWKVNKVVVVSNDVYFYRVHADSISTARYSPKRFGAVTVVEHVLGCEEIRRFPDVLTAAKSALVFHSIDVGRRIIESRSKYQYREDLNAAHQNVKRHLSEAAVDHNAPRKWRLLVRIAKISPFVAFVSLGVGARAWKIMSQGWKYVQLGSRVVV